MVGLNQKTLQETLKLPENYKIGTAVDDGGCFFDALAKILNQKYTCSEYSEKRLRQQCWEYYRNHTKQVDSWNQKDAITNIAHYEMIQYTKAEMDANFHGQSPIWGRYHIEGKILCAQLAIPAIHIIEVNEDPDNQQQLIATQFIVANDEVRQHSDELVYDENIPALIVSQRDLHFVPILSRLTHTLDVDKIEGSSSKEVRRLSEEKKSIKTEKNSGNSSVPIIQYSSSSVSYGDNSISMCINAVSPAEPPTLKKVPIKKIDYYISRESEQVLRNKLSEQSNSIKKMSIFGIAGSGKTTLAENFIGQYQQDYPEHSTFKLLAETKEQWWTSLKNWALGLHPRLHEILKNEQNSEEQERLIIQAIQNGLHEKKWCILVDNLDMDTTQDLKINDIEKLFIGQGILLITTQHKSIFADEKCLLDLSMGLKQNESEALLDGIMETLGELSSLGSQEEKISLIIALNSLPLSLVQAASYILWENKDRQERGEASFFTYRNYEILLRENVNKFIKIHIDLLQEKMDVPREESSYNKEFILLKTQEAAVDLSIQKAIGLKKYQQPDVILWQVLCFCCFLSCDGIPQQLIKDYWSSITPIPKEEQDKAFSALLKSGFHYSLWQYEKRRSALDNLYTLHLHRVLQRVLQEQYWPELLKKKSENIVTTIATKEHTLNSMTKAINERFFLYLRQRNYQNIREYIPHTKSWCTHWSDGLVDIVMFQRNQGSAYFLLGDYTEAELFYQKALSIVKEIQSSDPKMFEIKATILSGLGITAEKKCQYDKAEKFQRQAVDMITQYYHEPCYEIARMQGNLANTLEKQGKYIEAEHIHRQVLKTKITCFKTEENESVATTKQNLANVLERLGRFSEAEGFCREALRTKIVCLDKKKNAPDVAVTKQILGIILTSRGCYEEAEELLREALAMQIDWYKTEEHIEVAMTKVNLASALEKSGCFLEAELLCRKALAAQLKLYGKETNMVVAETKKCLAIILNHLNFQIEAERLCQSALEIEINHYNSANHIEVAVTQLNLALIQIKAGKNSLALQLLEQCEGTFETQPRGNQYLEKCSQLRKEITKNIHKPLHIKFFKDAAYAAPGGTAIYVAATKSEPVSWSNLPRKSNYFQPRKKLMLKLAENLLSDTPVYQFVLTGLAGNGKTSLILEWANLEKLKGRYVFVRFMLMDPTHQQESIIDLARECGISEPEKQSMLALLDKISSYIQSIPCLFIWDNVEKESDVHMLLQHFSFRAHNQQIVITSQDAIHWSDLPTLNVPAYEPEESVQYIEDQMRIAKKVFNLQEAKKLSETILFHHPLALELAMGLVCSWRVAEPLTVLSKKLQESAIIELNEKRTGQHSQEFINNHNLKTLWKINEESLSPEACKLLHWVSFLDSEKICEEYLINFLTIYYPGIDIEVQSEAINILAEHSLIRETQMQQWNIHRLLQRIVREDLIQKLGKSWEAWKMFLLCSDKIFNTIFFTDEEEWNISKQQQEANHIRTWLNHITVLFAHWSDVAHTVYLNRQKIKLWFKVGDAEQRLGLYEQSKQACTESLKASIAISQSRCILDSDISYTTLAIFDPAVPQAFMRLGTLHQEQGNLSEAEEHLKAAFTLFSRIHDLSEASRFNLAQSLMQLGILYKDQAKYPESFESLDWALNIYRSIFESVKDEKIKRNAHLMVAVVLDGLGLTKRLTGNCSQAIEYFEESLRIKECIYGENQHKDIADVCMNLGNAYMTYGNREKAIYYLERARGIYYRLLGNNAVHPDIALLLINLASAYGLENTLFFEYTNTSLSMLKRIHGEDSNHPSIATALMNIGSFYQKQGNKLKAILYFEESLAMRKNIYGTGNHEKIAESLYALGNLYRESHLILKAIEHLESALLMYRSIPDIVENSPQIAKVLLGLGIAYQNSDVSKAIEFCEQSLNIMITFPESSFSLEKYVLTRLLSELKASIFQQPIDKGKDLPMHRHETKGILVSLKNDIHTLFRQGYRFTAEKCGENKLRVTTMSAVNTSSLLNTVKEELKQRVSGYPEESESKPKVIYDDRGDACLLKGSTLFVSQTYQELKVITEEYENKTREKGCGMS